MLGPVFKNASIMSFVIRGRNEEMNFGGERIRQIR